LAKQARGVPLLEVLAFLLNNQIQGLAQLKGQAGGAQRDADECVGGRTRWFQQTLALCGEVESLYQTQ
jgi:hypothetical protein